VTRTEDYAEVVRFHGHECPGAALGLRIAETAVGRLGRHAPGNEIIALAETDICSVDAVQVITGCTTGKRNLRHADSGKNAFTFWRAGAADGLRVIARLGTDAYRDEQTWALSDKIEAGTATGEEAARFADLQRARIDRILAAPVEDLLDLKDVPVAAPERIAVPRSEPCAGCGEPTSVETLHQHRGRMLCPACHLDAHGGTLPAEHAGNHAHPAAHAESSHGHNHPH